MDSFIPLLSRAGGFIFATGQLSLGIIYLRELIKKEKHNEFQDMFWLGTTYIAITLLFVYQFYSTFIMG